MKTHLVVFISCTPAEVRNFNVFERAAEFSRYECSVEIRCEDGRELHCTCDPVGPTCWGWQSFKSQWEKKHGPIR